MAQGRQAEFAARHGARSSLRFADETALFWEAFGGITRGDSDEVIPFHQSQNLFQLANEPKRFRKRPGGTHNMPFDPEICEEAGRFLEATRSAL